MPPETELDLRLKIGFGLSHILNDLAASIWFTAALGITVAASSPVLALLALLLALVTLSDHPFHRNRRPGGPEGRP